MSTRTQSRPQLRLPCGGFSHYCSGCSQFRNSEFLSLHVPVLQRTPRRGTDESGGSGWNERATGMRKMTADRRSERRRTRARSSRPSRLAFNRRKLIG